MTQKQDTITILAIESSCDDTAASVIINNKIHANVVSSQQIHEQYGGVIPELAGRAHQQHIVPVVEEALKKANVKVEDLDAIAYTRGPGLMGSLLVGSQFAKGLSLTLNKPSIGVHHLHAHVAAHYLGDILPQFPFLNLLVSGGHTQIILVKDYMDMEIIASTLDDAAGEAFDKAAKMLGLPYPGGPLIDQYAEKGNPMAYEFPISYLPDNQFSFSGLKTSILYFLNKNKAINPNFVEENLNDICASIRHTIVKTLLSKFEKNAKLYKVKDLGIAGGVSANKLLRKEFEKMCQKLGKNAFIPKFEYCTDNAAMIASAAHYLYLKNEFNSLSDLPFSR
jgi:N6-L-threonylcarbamoyladenine synthase